MKTNIITFLIWIFALQLATRADQELENILMDWRRLSQSHDVNPGVPGPLESEFLENQRAIIDRFDSLGEGRDQALADFFDNLENNVGLREAALSVFRKTHKDAGKDHPMLQSIRRDLKRVSDSDFEYKGNLVSNCIFILNRLGDERDLPLLEALSRSDDPGYRWFCSLAIKQINARAALDRDPKRPSRGDTANQSVKIGETESPRLTIDQPNQIFRNAIFIGAILLLLSSLYVFFRKRRSQNG